MSNVAETATVAWGYTMADLNRLAWAACKRKRAAMVLDTEERYCTAWHGIVVALCTSPTAPAYHELIAAGLDALSQEVTRHYSYQGKDTVRTADGWNEAPNFTKYWRPIKQDQRWNDGFSDHLVETMSLPAVLGLLTPEQYEAIVTLAAYDNDFKAAANALGMKYHGFYYRVLSARRKVKDAWSGDETPVSRGNPTDTCRSGHDRAQYGVKRPNGSWACKICTRNNQRRGSARNRRSACPECGTSISRGHLSHHIKNIHSKPPS